MIRAAAFLLLAAVSWPLTVVGQDTVIVFVGESSRPARRAVSLFNGAQTKFFGRASVGRNERVSGRVGVLNGPLTISGVVRGDVVALNADVILREGAEVRGDILIVGGELSGLRDARVTGNTSAYSARITVTRDRDRVVLREQPARAPRQERRRPNFNRFDEGFDILLGANTYNRVEGLPIHVGPRVRWPVGSVGLLTLEGVGIIRTAGDFNETREDLGYRARADLTIYSDADVSLGVKVYDFVAPIEDWKLRNEEIGLGTFLWHRDYRDYFLRKGYGGYIRISPDDRIVLTGEVARNEEMSIAERDPWTLFRRDDLWRPNPVIDEATFTSFTARLEFGSQEERRYRNSDWYLSLEWERGQSDEVSEVPLPIGVRPALPTTDYTYDRVFIDLRRYERVGRSGLLALRAVGAGTIGDDPLPIQRRLSLGGPEPMPGFPFRGFACNEIAFDPSDWALCDRMLLFQAEYRGGLSFSTDWDEEIVRRRGRRTDSHLRDLLDWDDWFWFDGPEFVLFTNVGSAWIDQNQDGPDEFELDIGAGIMLGDLGIYGAKALTQSESFQVILRLSRRF